MSYESLKFNSGRFWEGNNHGPKPTIAVTLGTRTRFLLTTKGKARPEWYHEMNTSRLIREVGGVDDVPGVELHLLRRK